MCTGVRKVFASPLPFCWFLTVVSDRDCDHKSDRKKMRLRIQKK